jgi:hypothetical protein
VSDTTLIAAILTEVTFTDCNNKETRWGSGEGLRGADYEGEEKYMRTKEIIKRISKLPPKKQARVLSFVQLVESEPADDEIYEELTPELEDALIRQLSFAQGAWRDE